MLKRDESMKPDATVNRGSLEEIVMDLGKSLMIKGALSASEDLTLYGQMEGTIAVPDHTLSIGPHANIGASISARTVVIMTRLPDRARSLARSARRRRPHGSR